MPGPRPSVGAWLWLVEEKGRGLGRSKNRRAEGSLLGSKGWQGKDPCPWSEAVGTTQTPVLYHVPPDLTFRMHPLCSPPGQPVWQADCLLERAESQGPVSGAPGGHAAHDLSRNLCGGDGSEDHVCTHGAGQTIGDRNDPTLPGGGVSGCHVCPGHLCPHPQSSTRSARVGQPGDGRGLGGPAL